MNFHVTNKNICVDFLKVDSVTVSSLLLIGDMKTIQLSSALDVPTEAFGDITGPLVPVVPLTPTVPQG